MIASNRKAKKQVNHYLFKMSLRLRNSTEKTKVVDEGNVRTLFDGLMVVKSLRTLERDYFMKYIFLYFQCLSQEQKKRVSNKTIFVRRQKTKYCECNKFIGRKGKVNREQGTGNSEPAPLRDCQGTNFVLSFC